MLHIHKTSPKQLSVQVGQKVTRIQPGRGGQRALERRKSGSKGTAGAERDQRYAMLLCKKEDAGLCWGGRRHKDGIGKRMTRPTKAGALLFFTRITARKRKEILNYTLFQVAVIENSDCFPENVNPTVFGI